ncbi:MAG: hypothetical protein ABSB79_16640 [Syntrophales bacterium]|jgi:hypothetical protein
MNQVPHHYESQGNMKHDNDLTGDLKQLMNKLGVQFSISRSRNSTYGEKSIGGVIALVVGFLMAMIGGIANLLAAILFIIGIVLLLDSFKTKLTVEGDCPVCSVKIKHKLTDHYEFQKYDSFSCLACKKAIIYKDSYFFHFP